MPHTIRPIRSTLRRMSAVVLTAMLGAAVLPAVDAAAASASAPATQSWQHIAGMHAVKTHFAAVMHRNGAASKHKGGESVTASDGTTVSLIPAPPAGPARSTWVVNYDAGFTTASTGPQAQAAFQAAVDIWSRIVYSPVPIVVNASYADLGGNVLGQAAAETGFSCPCLGDGAHAYPVALANAMYGSDIDPTHPDIVAQFNSNPVAPFYYGTDGAPTSGMVDFESVVLHELGHGLGFAGSMGIVNGATNVTYSTTPMKWDTFLVDGSGTPMLSYASGSSQLTTALESPLYWSGTNGTSANGGTNPVMYAPASWEQGSSGGAHLDETAYPRGDANSLMTPAISAQEAVHSPGADAVAMFRDIGWNAVLPAVPAAPTAVTASRGDGRATVSWTASNDNGNAVTQYVATALPGGATCSTTGALTCDVTGLSNGTPYTFSVTATNAIGPSAASSASNAVTPAAKPAVPAAPTGTPNNGGVTVSWTAPSDNGDPITGYDVESSSDNGQTWSAALGSALTSSATQASFTGLANDTPYVFQVAAINGLGTGNMSPQSTAVTPVAGAPTLAPPGAPTAVQATRGNTTADVSWTAPADPGSSPITGYRLEWSGDNGGSWSTALTSALTSTATSATVTGLSNGTAYVFHVAAINAVDTGTFSTASVPVTPAAKPGTPTNVAGVRDGDQTVALTWTAPADGGDAITGYDVEWSTDGVNWSFPLDAASKSAATAATVSGLTDGTPYVFRVAATNGVGTGTFSNSSASVTPATAPGVPSAVSAVAGDQQAQVSWQLPADGGSPITSYDVRYSSDGGTTWTSAGVPYTASPATVTGLTNGASYLFEVAAINGVDASAYSAPTSAVTPWRDGSSLTQGASTTVNYGTALVLGTVLRDTTTNLAMPGYAVQLLRRTSTAQPWAVAGTFTTSSLGAAKVSVKPAVRTMYMWQFAGVPHHAATSSATQTVSVAQTVSAAQTASTIVHGGVVKFYGTVAPNEVNQYVYLQILVSRTWKTTALKAKLVNQRLPNGHTAVGFVLALKTATKGTYSYRVYRPATAVNAAGVSKTMVLRVT